MTEKNEAVKENGASSLPKDDERRDRGEEVEDPEDKGEFI